MSLNKAWEAASATPFSPIVSKDSQFTVGFNLLLLGKDSSPSLQTKYIYLTFSMTAIIFTGLFGLNRSFLSVASLGVPASLLFGFGAVFTICAAGVYV
ncbi:hypothetical protein N7462_007787 [Penicillium macrosclerotiorum]|uniref:uncharacterized protein n=1 Tax=Penicillium macrosclerotiorum TaxID=303699 RepID=UPI002546D02F|nr:uncharacterized protein N7462_007787 [Penicillium macrosclerotiorum]KAJ5679543.1 hypothetical protein N7462_007787 [Penicillium macrosclerotiorum]